MKVESESLREEVPVWLADRSEPEAVVEGWETMLKGKLKRWDIPGNHFQPFLPANVSLSHASSSCPGLLTRADSRYFSVYRRSLQLPRL